MTNTFIVKRLTAALMAKAIAVFVSLLVWWLAWNDLNVDGQAVIENAAQVLEPQMLGRVCKLCSRTKFTRYDHFLRPPALV